MSHRLLVATIGGSPEPITASLRHWRPLRVIFVVSAETKKLVSDQIVPNVQRAGWADFDAGRYDMHEIANAQDYSGIVAHIRSLDDRIASWVCDHPGTEVIADFTGGTKAMTAALAVAAARWPCQISYIGGTERTKGGVGIVVSGKEQIVHTQNPWDALGFISVEQAVVLFKSGNFSAAAKLLENARDRLTDPSRKREFQAFVTLCQLCDQWERFQHKDALNKLKALQSNKNDLSGILGGHRSDEAQRWSKQVTAQLEELASSQANQAAHVSVVCDLLGNAQRRFEQCAYDDAVARLYRAIEAIAQVRLHDHGFPDTAHIPFEKIPDPLRTEWQSRAAGEGVLKLGLQEDYALLGALGDDLATRFKKAKLDDPQRSPLVARNSSILAHGYTPVGEKIARQLLNDALSLASIEENSLLRFPELTST